MVDRADEAYLKGLFRSLQDKPLEPDDPYYLPLFEQRGLTSFDPIKHLARTVRFAEVDSVQLFSGFRGTGKSTELRRLKRLLEQDPQYKVVLCDMEDYLNPHAPVEITDFLLAIAGALSEELKDPELLGWDPVAEGYWTRFVHWLRKTEVDLGPMSMGASIAEVGADVKLNLRSTPSFRQKLQERMRLHLGAFKDDVHDFVHTCVLRLQQRHGEATQLVLLLDSVEHIRAVSEQDRSVSDSVAALFEGHAEKLRFRFTHVVYTVPPWLRIRLPGIDDGFDNCEILPCVKIANQDGQPFAPGYDALVELIGRRADWSPLLGNRAALNALIGQSGGYLRDLFRLLRKIVLFAGDRGIPADDELRELAIGQVRNSYVVGLTDDDARWLARIHRTGGNGLQELSGLERLAWYFDRHLVLPYANGHEWMGLHPLVRGHVLTLERRLQVDEGG